MHSSSYSFVSLVLFGLAAGGALAQTPADRLVIERLHVPAMSTHMDQADLLAEVQSGRGADAFLRSFLHGDALFDSAFNNLDGVGANVGAGMRFTRVPRADLNGPGQWARHVPARATGPNAQSCAACHSAPVADGAGSVTVNAIRDPRRAGVAGQMIQRNTPHLFGIGALQRLAEEMTTALHAQRDQLRADVLQSRRSSTIALSAKGVSFGQLRADYVSNSNSTVLRTNLVVGVDADLVVRPFQWKGSVASIRDFNRGAAHNEIGMQAVELVGHGVDGDFDQVTDELSVGDMTAMTMYVAAQPRPVSTPELSQHGIGAAVSFQQVVRIQNGETLFRQIGCTECHKPSLEIDMPIFQEPSAHPAYRDAVFPAGQNPLAESLRADAPVAFDLTADHPQNRFVVNGRVVNLGALKRSSTGKGIVSLYGDLKRHRMGTELAEPIDETGSGADMFLTENLWGVGSTAPYLHDGRATTLTEAILWHGGEALASRQAFRALNALQQRDVIDFLNSLVLMKGGLPIGG